MTDPLRLHWALTTPLGIQLDEAEQHWNSGCVRALLPLSSRSVLVGTDTGGVWLAEEDGAGRLVADLEDPEIRCLARARTPAQGQFRYFAAGDSFYVSEDTAGPPNSFAAIHDAAGDPWRFGPVNAVVYDPDNHAIVVASEQGVFWSRVPVAPTGPYDWIRAVRRANMTALSGNFYAVELAREPPGLVRSIVATLADMSPTGETQIFVGRWEPGAAAGPQLMFSPATVRYGGSIIVGGTQMSLASSEGDPYVVYGARSDPSGWFQALFRSEDGGASWELIQPSLVNPPADVKAGATFRDVASNQGAGFRANNCLAVSPQNSKIVVLGWRRGAAFVSTDSGRTFTTWAEGIPFHVDTHAVAFDPDDPRGRRLFIGSDGGVVRVDALGRDRATANSLFNKHLATMQFYALSVDRELYGSLGGPIDGDFIGGGTQDTNMLYTVVNPAGGAWRPLQGREASGDGHELVGAGSEYAVYNYNTGPKPRLAKWDAATKRFAFIEREIGLISTGPWQTLNRDTSRAMQDARLARLVRTFETNSGQKVFALASDRDMVLGLVIDALQPDGLWHLVVGPIVVDATREVNEQPAITAIDSIDGKPILLGYRGGHLASYSFARPLPDRLRLYQVPLALRSRRPTDPVGSTITHVSLASPDLGFAVLENARGSVVLRLEAETHVIQVPTGRTDPVRSLLAIQTRLGVVVLVAYEDRVLCSEDLGVSWREGSTGLPRMPHCTSLFQRRTRSGEDIVYLATYGRSVWQTKLSR